MKQVVLVGALVGALATITAGSAKAQQSSTAPKARGADTSGAQEGHSAPKQQPTTATAPSAPSGELALGTVRLPKSVKADGKVLPAGTYQVRLTGQTASPEAKGQTQSLERWVEFVQGGQVKGREVVTIVPQSEIGQVQKDAPPKPNSSKFETLKGGDYSRLWISRGGNYYLVHFPNA
jgi:hypothetical protein